MTPASSGLLRVGINLANPLLVTGSEADGAPIGVAPSLGAALAERHDLKPAYVTYGSAGMLAAATDWDVAFLADDPSRAGTIDFSPPYAEIEVGYLVHNHADTTSVTAAEVRELPVIAESGSAYELWLSANLPAARILRADGAGDALLRFSADDNAVLAGLTPALRRIAEHYPTVRLLPGRVTAVRQAIGVPAAGRREDSVTDAPVTAATIEVFVRDTVRSGLVAELVERFGVAGSLVIPEL